MLAVVVVIIRVQREEMRDFKINTLDMKQKVCSQTEVFYEKAIIEK